MVNPTPYRELQGLSESVKKWLKDLKTTIDSGVGAIPWASVSKTGANINEIPTRLHNSLQSMQGGTTNEFFHLTSAQNTGLTGGASTTLHKHDHNNLANSQGGDATHLFHLKVAIKGSKVQDFASIAGGAQSTTTITVTGATTTCVVALGFSSAPEAGIEFRAYVSAADTVTLEANNRTAGAIDPASRTYYVLVMDN